MQEGIDKMKQQTAVLEELLDARLKNLSPAYMTEEELSKLDAGIKKNTAMKKKLSTISEKTCDAVCKDIRSLNQSKFLAEAATALLQATTKASVIQWVLKVCSVRNVCHPECLHYAPAQYLRTPRIEADTRHLQTHTHNKYTHINMYEYIYKTN
jgi:DNA repair ATPase RecN